MDKNKINKVMCPNILRASTILTHIYRKQNIYSLHKKEQLELLEKK
jgi:hypothetical protein